MDSLKEYFENIDFGVVENANILDNVYEEINGHEKELILCPRTTYQVESLIRRSNAEQILKFIQKLDIKHLINKKLGSRVLEIIYDVVFNMVYKQGQAVDIKMLIEQTEEGFEHRFSDTNATHVLRKLFQLVSGRRILKNEIERHHPVEPEHIERYKQRIAKLVPTISNEDEFGTLLCYLRCYRSQSIVYEATRIHFQWKRVCEPTMSYFFEGLAKISGKKTLRYIFYSVKDRIMELCRDKYANYFIGEFIFRYHEKADYFFGKIDLSEFEENSNVIMKLVCSLQKKRSYENIDKIMRVFYLQNKCGDILSRTFGGVEGNFRQKYAPMLCEFMKFPEEHGYGVNIAFRKRFCRNWLKSRGGIELAEGYYEGSDSKELKQEFTRELRKCFQLLEKKKEHSKLLLLMRKYTRLHRDRRFL